MNNKKNNYMSLKIAKYLKNHNLKVTDIKGYKLVLSGLRVIFSDGTYHDFSFFKRKLNKKGAAFILGTGIVIGGATITGLMGSYYFNEKNDKLTLKNKEEAIVADQTFEDKNQDNTYEHDFNMYNNSQVNFEYVDKNTLNPYEFFEDNEPANIIEKEYNREINIHGSDRPYLTSYDYVINNYYKAINKYGTRYGVDPAIVASLIMVECGNSQADAKSQTNYSALGLGQVNCKFFENKTFNVYNFENGEYEKYTFKYDYLKNDHDEQIKFIAILLQTYSFAYKGNLNAMLVSYNQGVGTVSNIINIVINNTECINKDDVLSNSDTTLISKYNTYKYGDPEYFNKVTTYLSYVLENEAFGSKYASIKSVDGEDYLYNVVTEVKIGSNSR